MNRIVKQALVLCAALASLASSAAAFAQATFPGGPNPTAVTTFHSIGLYWHVPGAGSPATVKFRAAGTVAWRDGLELWYDSRNGEYRGSLVELKPGTTYDIELSLGGSTSTLQAATWSEEFPVPTGHTVTVPTGMKRIIIRPTTAAAPTTSVSGTTLTVDAPTGSGGFTHVTANPGQNVIAGSDTDPNNACIEINHGTRNVIVSNLVLQNCKRYGIDFFRGSSTSTWTDTIVIDGNEFVGWGGFDAVNNVPFNDGALRCNFDVADMPKPQRIIMQRNVFRDPRWGANSWDTGHPLGARVVQFSQCGSNHVFRYNDVHANGNGNHFMDGVGGAKNFSTEGSPGADSDIYGNRISHVKDDAIEAEGGNRNVRIWANYIERTNVAIANAATVLGPLYVWRNVTGDMALINDPEATDEGISSRGPFVKAGSNSADPAMNGGRAYYFHNTLLQPPSQQGQAYPRGAGTGLSWSGGSLPFYNFVSLNNIWHIHRVPDAPGKDYRSIAAGCDVQGPCTADYDFFNGKMTNASNPDAPEVNGTGNPSTGDESSVPTYATSGAAYPAVSAVPSDANGWSGNFTLAAGSLGQGSGVRLANFNDRDNPDPGAHQWGTPPMVFGRNACLPYYSSCKSR